MCTLIQRVNSKKWRSRIEAYQVPTHDHVDYALHSDYARPPKVLFWKDLPDLFSGCFSPCLVESLVVEKLHPPKEKADSNQKYIVLCSQFLAQSY